MRILIINSEYPPIGGGAGNASANLARCLVEMGQQVTVLTSRYGALPRRERREEVEIIRLPALRKRADRSGVIEQLSFLAGGTFGAWRTVRRWRPQVTLAFFGMPAGGIALVSNVLSGQPYVVSLRGGDVPGFRPYDFLRYHRMIAPLLRVIWRRSGGVVANSGGLRSLAQRFDRTVPIQIIPNGVDAEAFAPPTRDWQSPNLLFVGRVVYQKGLDLLLHALGALRELSWQLTIVGDGPLRPTLEKLAENLGIGGRIRFSGWKKEAELVAEYHQANLFVYPSRHEGMPNAVLEAMAAGLPVIATRIAGNEELVRDGESGLLIQRENQQGLEIALRRLLLDSDLREQMGAAGRQRAIECYPWEKTARSYLEILRRVSHG